MYKEGNIIYFTPFYFKNGTNQTKYFVVIKVINEKTILASLPTRTDSVPEKEVKESGCIELPEINFNCFAISDKSPVTVCNKTLDFPTYIYGQQLDTYELEQLQDYYKFEGIDYEIYGEMKPEIFNDLVKCLKNSKSVKGKHLKVLQ